VARKYQKFNPEFREQAAKLVVEGGRSTTEVAREYGIGETTLGNWVKKYRLDHPGEEPPLELPERAELAELRRRVREQEMELAFLKKVIMPAAPPPGPDENRCGRPVPTSVLLGAVSP
jgi:transposase